MSVQWADADASAAHVDDAEIEGSQAACHSSNGFDLHAAVLSSLDVSPDGPGDQEDTRAIKDGNVSGHVTAADGYPATGLILRHFNTPNGSAGHGDIALAETS